MDSNLAAQGRVHLAMQGVFGAVALGGVFFASALWLNLPALLLGLVSCLLALVSQVIAARVALAAAVNRNHVPAWAVNAGLGCWFGAIGFAALAVCALAGVFGS